MLSRIRTLANGALLLGAALSSLACSSLTRPDEITIAAEPLPTQEAPAPAPALPGMARGAQGAPAAGTG